MAPVKRRRRDPDNPVAQRLLAIAELVAPAEVKPTLAHLERLAKLRPGILKEAVKRESVSKAVTTGLINATPRLGIGGLTADWLQFGRGDPPYKSNEKPLVVREGSRSRYGGPGDETAESGAPTGMDLAEEIARSPEQFARRMETAAAKVGAELTIAYIDDAEKILRQNGLDFTGFLAALRARLRAQRQASGGKGA